MDSKFLERVVKISLEFSRQESVELEAALKRNANVFAWSARDMPGVSPKVITHKLNVDPTCHPVKQKRRNFASNRS